jgi:hypothetical protein
VVVCRLGTTPIADEGLKVVRDLVSFSGDVVFIAEGH